MLGLCRTSEIFGVSEFVIGSLDYVKEQAFQNLSVTSHKWVPIVEVRVYPMLLTQTIVIVLFSIISIISPSMSITLCILISSANHFI